MPPPTDRLARRAEQSNWIDRAVGLGLIAYGIVHVVVAVLAIQLALGDHSEKADSTGALHEIAQQPLGEVLLWGVALGMFLLVAWRLLQVVLGDPDADSAAQEWLGRGAHLGTAVIYGAIGGSALKVLLGSSGSQGTDGPTARLMNLPAGQWLVGAAGVLVVGFALWMAWYGASGRHAEHLAAKGKRGQIGTVYLALGTAGYLAKGVAIGLVGALFVYAAVTHDPTKSGGLDVALAKVLQQPFGSYLLIVLGLGIGCYGLFCFATARHLRR
ncbi:MAG: DUF1206 domain-containing protein [Nocardioides sp.]|nr:DUF1206 domain-containing protein [Nocardioides sp.]